MGKKIFFGVLTLLFWVFCGMCAFSNALNVDNNIYWRGLSFFSGIVSVHWFIKDYEK